MKVSRAIIQSNCSVLLGKNMKKIITYLLIFLCILTIVGCSKETVSLIDTTGLSYEEIVEHYGSDLVVNKVTVPTNEFLPGTVIGYEDKQVNELVKKESAINILVADMPEDAVSFDENVLYVSRIDQLTGKDSVNNADILIDSGIMGTDLGFSFDYKGQTVFLFGDTFGGENRQGMWYSNFVAISDDKEYHDGIAFSEVVSRPNGMALPFAQGAHQDGNETDNSVEVTKIPTGAVTIGDTAYLFYMSVRYWGASGKWNINYNQCLKSTDLYTWEEVDGLRWTEELAFNFGQIYPMDDPNSDYVYIYGIPGGRFGRMVCGRVLRTEIEDFEKYEYQVDDNVWVKGTEGLKQLKENPYYLTEDRAAEPCICYNPYLGKYMFLNSVSGVWMYTGDTPYQKFTERVKLMEGNYASIYGPATSTNLLVDDGKAFYLVGSNWGIYNVILFKIVLK